RGGGPAHGRRASRALRSLRRRAAPGVRAGRGAILGLGVSADRLPGPRGPPPEGLQAAGREGRRDRGGLSSPGPRALSPARVAGGAAAPPAWAPRSDEGSGPPPAS